MKDQPPRIIAFAVQTLDGYVARHPGHSTLEWRSNADAEFFTSYLNSLDETGVIVVGNNTYKAVQSRLSKRNCIVLTRSVESMDRRHKKLLYYNPGGASLAAVINGYRTVVLLGGTETYTFFWERDLIDELYLTIEPINFGSGLRLLNTSEPISAKLSLKSSESLNEVGTVLRHYQRKALTQTRK